MATNVDAKVGAPWSPTFGYLVISLVPSAFLAIFFFLPLASVIVTSFTEPTLGFSNYQRAFTNEAFVNVFLYTIETAALVSLICLVLAFPAAALLARSRGKWVAVALALILVPCWISTVIRTYAWILILQKNGALNGILLAGNLIKTPTSFLNSTTGVLIGMVHVLLPFMILPLVSSLRQIDSNLLRAAGVLGAGPIKTFVWVYIPLAMPGIVAGCTLVFITSLGFFITPALLGGASNTMIAVLISQQVMMLGDWGMAAALSTILLASTMLIYLVFGKTLKQGSGNA